ncbi:MAG: hypothetical protein EZS28_035532 [Streblomastix strix]|uniref:Uncharacterized protein n=1 Tax=Streblomastix strix TaxID=222440 RepID=A0A5J4UFV1_9EUKA|nr:MAG: hypothetical protein EZS28_035532 [Streblomastix strix]
MPVWTKKIDEKGKWIRPPIYADQHFLMLFDSHSSRGDLDMIRELRLNNIDAVSIVPNSSEGTAALLFPPSIRQGFKLSGYLDGQAENCLKQVPDKPQVPDHVVQSYHPKPRGFALGAKVMTDQLSIDRWQDFNDLKDARQEEIDEKRIERLMNKNSKLQEKTRSILREVSQDD